MTRLRGFVGVFVSVFLLFQGGGASAEPRDDLRVFFFGNSLIHHLSDDGRSNVPHWLNELAKADGRTFAQNGQWGTPRDFAKTLPPKPNWSFRGVPRAWNPDRGGFEIGRFDTIVLNPENFVQYQAPDQPYDGSNPDESSPISATERVLDFVTDIAPEARIFIYEGWADMASITGRFPPSGRGLRRYHRFNQGDYHDWYVAYADALQSAFPEADIRLIPVAQILSDLLTSDPLSGLAAEVFYVDDAPHGTETLYFLAAMISYSVLYEAPLPDYVAPDTIDATVAAAYPELAERIWQATGPVRDAAKGSPQQQTEEAGGVVDAAQPEAGEEEAAQTEAGEEEAAQTAEETPSDVTAEVAAPPQDSVEETRAAPAQTAPELQPVPSSRIDGVPALAMGLNGISDWSTQHPFLDHMKTARQWVGHIGDDWGAFPAERLRAEGYLDENGWPLRIPDGVDRLESVLLTDQPEEAQHLRGWYELRYEGKGELSVGGRARRVQYDEGRARFFYEPGEGLVGISISRTDPDDPIRNISVVAEEHLDLHEAGAVFNPVWIDKIDDLRVLRFMDWMDTNNSVISDWNERPRVTDFSYTSWGVPLPVMVRLANRTGTDPWFTMPHLANDDYVRQFAETVRDTLDPDLKVYVEYSNEMWNFGFDQARWAQQQAEALWGPSETGWMQFYGKRASQVADIWTDVFGEDADRRLVRVAAVHTGWPGLEDSILQAPLAMIQTGKAPVRSFDAYAVTGYFGFETGGEVLVPEIRSLIKRSTALAERRGRDEGLRRVALREYVRENRFDGAFAPMAEALRTGSFGDLLDKIWPYHAQAARKHGLDLIMYEGGTHVTAQAAFVDDEDLSAFFIAFNYSDEMGALYRDMLGRWDALGGRLFNAFVDVAPPSQWGSWGNLRYLGDATSRWDALMAYNATASNGWEPRRASDFKGGVTLIGTDSADDFTGSTGDDVMTGAEGDDLFETLGGTDVLHGGPGADRAILPGSVADYAVVRDGARTRLAAAGQSITLTGIEEVGFAAQDGVWRPVESLGQ